jgi:hypothetical protein
MSPGQVERRAHDYVRHGTTSLFATLEVATGNVLTKRYCRHRSIEFRHFLDQIDAAVPKDHDSVQELGKWQWPVGRWGSRDRGTIAAADQACTKRL